MHRFRRFWPRFAGQLPTRGWGMALLLTCCAGSPAQPAEGNATLFGIVRDAHGPLGASAVSLTPKTSGLTLTTTTDAQGAYRFSNLASGAYSLHAALAGHAGGASDTITIQPGESKQVDLMLNLAGAAGQAASAQPAPEFFDEPSFIVAGVTDSAYQGAHGSDSVMRSAEALAKATASLGKDSGDSARRTPPAGTTLEALEDAASREPDNFDAQYKLAAALLAGGQYERARTVAAVLAGQWDRAASHHLLGEVDERGGHSLEAAREYQRAGELDSSETNLFDWGTELLAHRADEPAVEVFSKGRRLYPRSKRMILGLAAAWYARGAYDQAEERFLEATDLDPRDPEPYLFLAKVRSSAITDSDAYLDRLARFATLQPENALANCHYAAALWKRCQKEQSAMPACATVEPLLEKAARLDPQLGSAYLQLGMLYAARKDFPRAIAAYQKAIDVSPELEEAHYRLAQVYRQTSEPAKAQEQIALSNDLAKKSADQFARERAEIQQFVIELKAQPPAAKP